MAAISEAPARQRAVDLLVDYLAVARRGSLTASSEVSRRAIGVDVTGPALVEGTTGRASAEVAALLNGTGAHSLELDDTYEPASLHPGVAVWPAVLALADELGTPARAAVDAGISGYDVACRLGDRLGPARAYARGFHPTGVCGVVGAAAACAELLGLDERASEEAMGIATSLAGGLLAFLGDGAWTKRLHAGRAAEGGIRAARLAAEGFAGPRDAFAGPHGFLHAFGGHEEAPAAADSPRGSGVLCTAVKLHPCCRYAHGCLDLLIELAPDPGEIDDVRCSVLSAGWTLIAEPIELKRHVRSPVEAQFSMPFTAALAISRRAVRLEDIERAEELSEELAPLMERIACTRDGELDAAYPASWGAAVAVRMRDGEILERRASDPVGSPARPVARDQILAKAAQLAGDGWAAAAAEAAEGLLGEAALADVLEPIRGAIERPPARPADAPLRLA